jgi:transmembrane sensor
VFTGIAPRIDANRRRRRAAFVVASALVLILVVFFARARRSDAPAPFAITPWDTTATAARAIVLPDGSRIELRAGATSALVESTTTRVHLRQDSGRARYVVTPGGPRLWSIDTPAGVVEVVGTIFVIDVDRAKVRVEVERGRVLAAGRSLGAGESIDLVRDVPASSLPSVAVEDLADAAETAPARAPTVKPVSSARADRVGELLDAADAARASGRPADAVRPLEEIVSSHPRDPRAPLAAFTLGRIELDAVGDPVRAARAFARAIELGINDPLREDAYVRRVEAFARAGDTSARDAAAKECLARYPGASARIARWTSAP